MDQLDPEQEVIQFIADHLPTVPHLEAVLLIWQNPTIRWSAETLASRVYVSPAVARTLIEDLKRDGLLVAATAEQDSGFIFNSSWDEQRRILPRLADLYRRQLVQVTKLIHSKGSSSVREFARAFQIKKDH